MLRIAVCDDEASAVAIVKSVVAGSVREQRLEADIAAYTGAGALLDAVRGGRRYDLLLLDVDMPGMDGIELGIAVRELLRDSLLIYVSSREERVFDSFQARPFRFIRKSTLAEEWPGVLREAVQELKARDASKLILVSGPNRFAVRPEDIIYAEALRKKQVVHTVRGTIDLTDGFENLVSQLEGKGFIRSHRSYVVNYRFIFTVNRADIELDDGTLLPIGRSKTQAVQEEFHRMVLSGL